MNRKQAFAALITEYERPGGNQFEAIYCGFNSHELSATMVGECGAARAAD